MDSVKIVKWLGILIVVVMAASMLAAALLYGPQAQDSTTTTDTTTPTTNTATEFTYDSNFATTVTSEINALRIRATTSEIDKSKVDAAVQSVSGVSRESSKFISGQNGTWDYFADIYLTRSANITTTAQAILALDIFSSNPSAKSLVKYVRISSPGKIALFNKDLNITRDFNFDGSTLTALVDPTTQIGDAITVSGTIKIRGTDLTFVELIETTNTTGAAQNYSVNETFPLKELKDNLFFDAQHAFDANLNVDAIVASIQALDANTQVFAYPTDINQPARIVGQTTTAQVAKITDLLSQNDFVTTVTQEAAFDANTITIPAVNQTFDFNSSFPAQVKLGHSVNDSVPLTLSVSVTRGVIVQVTGQEQ